MDAGCWCEILKMSELSGPFEKTFQNNWKLLKGRVDQYNIEGSNYKQRHTNL